MQCKIIMSNYARENVVKLRKAVWLLGLCSIVGCSQQEIEPETHNRTNQKSTEKAYSISQGRADNIEQVLLECDVPGWRITAIGNVNDSNGKVWKTPAEVNFTDGPKAHDLFNECNDVTLDNAAALELDNVPITEIDEDGEVYTLYFFGDNYAEIYVNGQLIGVDPVPYWPFNTSAVRFKAKRPFVLGAKLVDWEENLNLGSELMRGVPFHNGDGGFVAVLKDNEGETVTITDEQWRVQFFYASPLLDPSCIVDTSNQRNSLACTSPEKANAEESYAVRWNLPDGWGQKEFNDSSWTSASLYTNADIGGSLNRPAYSNFADLFDDQETDAQFIWSSNLLLDNLVLARKTIE